MKGKALADESGDVRRAEELQKKIAELKEKTLQEESQRLEADTQKRAEASLQNYRVTEEKAFRQRLQEAVDNRKRDENFIRAREQELNSIFDEERRKKTETLRREAEKKRHAAEEERKRQEEIARLKAEEEEKIRREEERRRAEEEERQRLEAERKRREEEALRLELERQRREEERRRQEEERRERIRSQINEAQTYFDKNEYEHALVEVAKALVNDPSNEAALKLDSKIREILRSAKEQEPAEEQPKPARKKARRTVLSPAEEPRKRNPATIVLVIAGIAVIALAVMLLLRRQVFNSDFRIAVIPWTSQTQTAEEQILGSALAMETAGRLNRLPTVTLLGYSSAFHIAGAREDPSRYIFDMGYHYILIGTVTRNEQHVTLTIRLVDSSGRVAWSNVYDRPPTLLASLPDDIALQMVLSMKIPRPDGWLEHGEKIPSDAFDNFLHGKAALLGNTRESMDTALYYFRTALRTTPSYTEALSGAADALLTIYEKRWNHADTVLSRARQYAQATIEADTSSAEGYYQLARVFSQRAKLNEAITEYDNALSRDPNLADAWREKAKVHFRLGQTTQAIDALQRAAELNPRDPEVNTTFGLMYQITRSPARSVYYHELAMAVTRDTISYITGTLSDAIISDPELRLREGHRIITACYRRLQAMPGDYVTLYSLARLRQVTGSRESDSLLRTLQRMCQAEIQQQPKNPVPLMVMAKTLNRLGRFPEATDFALRAMAIDTSDVEMRYQVAQVYAMQMYSVRTKGIDQQKKEASLKELRRAINHSYLLGQIASADFYNMIDQPEFQAAIQTITPQR